MKILSSRLFLLIFVTLALMARLAEAKVYSRELAPQAIKNCFQTAAQKYNVPETLLLALAKKETGGFHNIPEALDTSSTEIDLHPRFYGIMGLRNDFLLGFTLTEASKLLHEPMARVAEDPCLNISGAAAVLSANAPPSSEKERNFGPALLHYWNLGYGTAAFEAVNELIYHVDNGSESARLAYAPQSALARSLRKFTKLKSFHLEKFYKGSQRAEAEYPLATWDKSPNFDAGAVNQLHVIMHTTEGSFDGAVDWLKKPQAKVSAHYVIRRRDGFIKQLVHESDKAWHARCWNGLAIAVEMEGFVADSETYSPALYEAGSKLARYLAEKYKIPQTDMRIVGHDFWNTERFKNAEYLKPCNDHDDPGRFFDWTHFFSLLTGKN